MKKVEYNFDYIMSIQQIDTTIGYSYNKFTNPLNDKTTIDNDINFLDAMINLTKKDLKYINKLENIKKIGNNLRYLRYNEINLNNIINKKQYYTFAFILYTHLFLDCDEFDGMYQKLFFDNNEKKNKYQPRFAMSRFLKGFNPILDKECCEYCIQFIKDKVIIETNQKFINKESFAEFFKNYKEIYGLRIDLPDNYDQDKSEELLRNYLKENIKLFDLKYILNFMNYNDNVNQFYREVIFEINDTCWIEEIYRFNRFIRYDSFKINKNEEEFKNNLNKAIMVLICKINNRMVTLRNIRFNRYNRILERVVFYNSCEIIETFNLLRMRFMLNDKNLITKYEKEINKLICILYKFYLKNKKIMSSYLNKIIREVSKEDYFYKNEYLMSIRYKRISNRNKINSYKLIIVRFIRNILIKQNKRGVDLVQKFKITPNNLSTLLTSDLF